MPGALTYASPPPSDRVDVVWRRDELEMTVPARPTGRAIAVMTVLVGASILLWRLAFRGSLGGGGSAGGAILIAGGIAGRVMALVFGAFCFARALMVLRHCRTWARITLGGPYLIFKAPSLLPLLRDTRVRRVYFNNVTHVSVDRLSGQRDSSTYLLLHRATSPPEPVLVDLTHRVGDLQIVAAVLREAIARRKLAA
jgi:hypothetical protein